MKTRVLLIGTVWPEPTSSAAGLHHWSLIRAFQKADWEITYVSPAVENPFTEKLRQAGIATRNFLPNDSSFDAFVRDLQPHYTVFDRFVIEEQFGWRVRENAPESVRVIDTEDLHCLRRTREKALKAGVPLEKIFNADLELTNDDSLREIASIYRSDCSLIISDFELTLLREKFRVPEQLLQYFPFCYPPPLRGVPFASRKNFCMIGNFRHPPNADATRWLHREIWPEIVRQFKAAGCDEKPELHIYGAYPSREMMELSAPATGLIVKGPAADQYETLARYRVNLAPLRFGAGIKGKIADGWWCGLPAVTTPIGSEGMGGRPHFGGTVGESTAELAKHAVTLYLDQVAWERESRRGLEFLESHFDSERNSARLLEGLEKIRRNLSRRRRDNFIGEMLWHHQHKSTTYFSRWIELKEARNRKPETDT